MSDGHDISRYGFHRMPARPCAQSSEMTVNGPTGLSMVAQSYLQTSHRHELSQAQLAHWTRQYHTQSHARQQNAVPQVSHVFSRDSAASWFPEKQHVDVARAHQQHFAPQNELDHINSQHRMPAQHQVHYRDQVQHSLGAQHFQACDVFEGQDKQYHYQRQNQRQLPSQICGQSAQPSPAQPMHQMVSSRQVSPRHFNETLCIELITLERFKLYSRQFMDKFIWRSVTHWNLGEWSSEERHWIFPTSMYSELVGRLKSNNMFTCTLDLPPDWVLKQVMKFRERRAYPDIQRQDIASLQTQVESSMNIPDKLYRRMMPYQREGCAFGISRDGRCLIGDELGLG
eukprot:TRINITY_DN13636_c0_g3_i1.p1 TRINITY_DN13636_c0_g3~~TRINITY_DN13636_c0_g3_i1.p1  ORF type:complete len:356 (-),score=20.60 TRINITY_DN13636_c0_g3_i1:68-1093(-)